MAESIIHELNAQFNDMDLKSKIESRNKIACQEDSTVHKRSNNYDTEEHCMPYHTLTDSKDITHICTLCGGNLYAVITKDDFLKEHLLVCPRGCGKPLNTVVADNLDGQEHNIQPLGTEDNTNYQQRQLPHSNGGYMSNYNPYQPQDMDAMQNHDYRFNLTTELMAAQTADLMQLLDTIDCDNCHSKNHKEKPNRFKAAKRRNVRRTEYQLSGRRTYWSNGARSGSDFSSDLGSMAERMFECSKRLSRFYEQLECNQGCKNCGGI